MATDHPSDALSRTPSLRQLKAALAVAQNGSVTAAATALNRSQSAVTKALKELESQLGCQLFDRQSRGMIATAPGRRFLRRVKEAEAQFTQAEIRYKALVGGGPAGPRNPLFSMDVSQQRLAAFIALHETRDMAAAAERLGQTTAAVYASVRHLEGLLDLPLFEHAGPRPSGTAFADVLASHCKLAFALIRHGVDELASSEGHIRGSVVVGTLPYSRTVLTPRTIHRVLEAHPQLHISTREGPYSLLEAALRSGDLDLVVGATRDQETGSNLKTLELFEDELSVIAGRKHPLAGARRVTLAQLLRYGWILPLANTPARKLFDRYLERQGAQPPAQVIETSSLSTIRGLLLDSHRLALLSRHQVYYDEAAGLLTALPIRLEGTSRPIGLTLRAGTTPSPAAGLFIEALRSMAAELDAAAENATLKR